MPVLKKRKLNSETATTTEVGESSRQPSKALKVSKATAESSRRKRPVQAEAPVEPEDSEQEIEDDFEGVDVESEGAQGEAGPSETTISKKTFADLGVIDSLVDACTNLGFKHPTPIQEQAIPLALEGRDMYVS